MGVAIVTGASSGMGREFARALAARDDVDEVWIVARRAERLEALAGELATPTCVICADLSTDEGLAAVRSELEENKPLVSYLVNAAGLGKVGSYATISDADVASMVDVNCRAAVLLTQMTIPYMTRGSHILEVVSCASFLPLPHLNVYAASKAFMQSYTRGLRWELRGTGICATAVCPFWVRTDTAALWDASSTSWLSSPLPPESQPRWGWECFRSTADWEPSSRCPPPPSKSARSP